MPRSLLTRLVLLVLAAALLPAGLVALGAHRVHNAQRAEDLRLEGRGPDLAPGSEARAPDGRSAAAPPGGERFWRDLLPWTSSAFGAGLALSLLGYVVYRPLRTLSRGVLHLANGQSGAQVEVGGGADLERLAQVFNYMSQQLLAYEGETFRLYQGREASHLQMMVALASVLDSKDRYTHGHSQRVGDWAAAIGRELGLPELELRHLHFGGVLHDVGKIGVAEPILRKRGSLTDEEMTAMRAHPEIGASIIGNVDFLRPMVAAVRHHHERWDGKGYPDRLAGEAIPLIARIVGAADVWDACTSTRSYQQAMPAERALEVLRRLSGTALDPRVVAAIERVVRRKLEAGEPVSAADVATTPEGPASSGAA